MTIEEKAKAYDEALEIARKSWLDNQEPGYKHYREFLESMFPDLRESEDERIRKALLEKFTGEKKRGAKYEIHGCSLDSIISFLEKQKEQKPWKVGANAYFTPEQKPAEWSEEDKDMIAYIVAMCDDGLKDCVVGSMAYGVYNDIKYWINNLCPQYHWKPSDEQMEALKEASASWMNEKMGNAELLKSLYDALKKNA